jgi:predicted DNA-binding transcriptional regulator AlpA
VYFATIDIHRQITLITVANHQEKYLTMTEVADQLVPQPKVEREFDRTSMSLWRWLRDPKLNFPRPVKIRNRNYWRRADLENFKQRLVDESLRRK